ncbi:MAG: substrate-binding domain-containing protein, partial [Candidatus Moduliflexus flocculans]|nr:substrate-binding domain-containing protein [Candidatus Moduliflexus flocculans]
MVCTGSGRAHSIPREETYEEENRDRRAGPISRRRLRAGHVPLDRQGQRRQGQDPAGRRPRGRSPAPSSPPDRPRCSPSPRPSPNSSRKTGSTDQITIDSIGSGAGFERFTKTGETDISNASAKIKPSNIEAAAKLSPPRVPIEFRVGTDALAVCVSTKNKFAKDVTMAELAKIFSTAENWSDVRADWPKKPIKKFTPGTDSGTFDYFVEHVFQEGQETSQVLKKVVGVFVLTLAIRN